MASAGRCQVCGATATADEYCQGCKAHVCSECNVKIPPRVHEPRDHSEES